MFSTFNGQIVACVGDTYISTLPLFPEGVLLVTEFVAEIRGVQENVLILNN